METVLYLASLTTEPSRSRHLGPWPLGQFALVSFAVLLSLFFLLRTV
ncbi:hypothetical protein BJ928_10872 [Rhizobium sp. WW_1]|jgi:hypothetical protein|nr:hypothetical protein BJ928_10872 [Rhizobium sp. WW_1]